MRSVLITMLQLTVLVTVLGILLLNSFLQFALAPAKHKYRPTADGGKKCTDSSECQSGRCYTKFGAAPPANPSDRAVGFCSYRHGPGPTLGCFTFVVDGKVNSRGCYCGTYSCMRNWEDAQLGPLTDDGHPTGQIPGGSGLGGLVTCMLGYDER
jgi:hypothetical protein